LFTWRQIAEWGSYVGTGVILALMPKCPACLAAYVALFTGLGLSLGMATSIWWFLAMGCMICLALMTFRLTQAISRRIAAKPLVTTTSEVCGCSCRINLNDNC
jgi:hypothetical protein